MKESVKANLIIFLIIAVLAFVISSAFASLTIVEKTDSYKLSSIENDSFEPNYIEEVPTIMPKVETNLTNNTTETNTTVTDDNWTNILNETIEEWDDWQND
jgi:flagellar basal body-associated protein FliL